MKPLEFTSENALPILRAFKTVASAKGAIEDRQRAFIETHQKEAGVTTNVRDLVPITAEELAAKIADPDLRLAIVQRMVVVALLDEVADREEIDLLQMFSKTLGVREPAVGQAKLAASRSAKRLAFDMLRHGFLAKVFRDEWNAHGVSGILRSVRAMSGGTDETVANKFRALRDLPAGTLGAHYIAYMDANKFGLPGEPKGAGEALIFHDLGHALTSFTTDVAGEMRMAGFEAGYMREDGFGVVALALFGFHMGLPLPNIAACRGGFDWQAITEGYRLGRKLKVDLRNWSPWSGFDRPLAEVRAELGLAD